jgi:hypothetical protein
MNDDATTFDKIQKYLFEDKELAKQFLNPRELEIKHRWAAVYSFWIDKPEATDRELVRFMRAEFGIEKSQAYNDLPKIKLLLGNVKAAGKEYYRLMVVEMCKKAYNVAMTKGDAKAMAMAADKIGKYTKLDKDELEALPWDQLFPPNFEPSNDVSVLGITLDADFELKREKLKRKYMDNIEEAVVINE